MRPGAYHRVFTITHKVVIYGEYISAHTLVDTLKSISADDKLPTTECWGNVDKSFRLERIVMAGLKHDALLVQSWTGIQGLQEMLALAYAATNRGGSKGKMTRPRDNRGILAKIDPTEPKQCRDIFEWLRDESDPDKMDRIKTNMDCDLRQVCIDVLQHIENRGKPKDGVAGDDNDDEEDDDDADAEEKEDGGGADAQAGAKHVRPGGVEGAGGKEGYSVSDKRGDNAMEEEGDDQYGGEHSGEEGSEHGDGDEGGGDDDAGDTDDEEEEEEEGEEASAVNHQDQVRGANKSGRAALAAPASEVGMRPKRVKRECVRCGSVTTTQWRGEAPTLLCDECHV